MRGANPILIPRDHRVEQAIQSAYVGDFVPFHRLVDALAAPPTPNKSNTLTSKRHRGLKKSSKKLSAAPSPLARRNR